MIKFHINFIFFKTKPFNFCLSLLLSASFSVQGEHLQSGFGKGDIHVLIAGLPCNVTDKTESVLKCKPTFKDSFVGDGKSRVVQVRLQPRSKIRSMYSQNPHRNQHGSTTNL